MQTVLALCVRVLNTLYLAVRLWLLSQWRHWSLCVGFLYTVVSRLLLGPVVARVSLNGRDPLVLGSSAVNCMCCSMQLRCCRNCCLCSAFWITKVSSTYLYHTLGGYVAVLMAYISNSSMKRLATMGLMGEPMVAHESPHNTYLAKG